jgi:renalase
VGGRIATRRDGTCTYDHGAQFYKIEDHQNLELDKAWSSQGIAKTWFKVQNVNHKVAPNGLTHLPKSISDKSQIVFEEKVTKITEVPASPDNEFHVRVQTESGQLYFAKRCFVAVPLPQTLEILKHSKIAYPEGLNEIKYAPAIVGLFQVESQSVTLRETTYLDNFKSDVFSVSNQLSKAVSQTLAFTVVMRASWSEQNFELDESEILTEVSEQFSRELKKLDPSAAVVKAHLKKWRYSHPVSAYSKKYEVIGTQSQIVLLGDAFGGPSIVGAISSADSVLI